MSIKSVPTPYISNDLKSSKIMKNREICSIILRSYSFKTVEGTNSKISNEPFPKYRGWGQIL